jgi:hypothetical protein
MRIPFGLVSLVALHVRASGPGDRKTARAAPVQQVNLPDTENEAAD